VVVMNNAGLRKYFNDKETLLGNTNGYKFFFLLSKVDVLEVIEKGKIKPRDFSATYTKSNNEFLKITMKRKVVYNREEKNIEGELYIMKYSDGVYLCVTYENLDIVERLIFKFFDRYYIDAARLSITSKQIEEILDLLKTKFKCEITTDNIVSYSRLNKKKFVLTRHKRRVIESDLRWTEEDYKTSFVYAAENDKWIDKISFYAQTEKISLFHATISRNGVFESNRYSYSFFKVISDKLIGISKENLEMLSNKSRVEQKIKPIAIEYSVRVFEDVQQNKKLINAIKELPKSDFNVYHGNPYLHGSLVDYIDGSSYDIWVMDENNIIIVPQIRATFSSLSRITSHIMKRFLEGRIIEVEV